MIKDQNSAQLCHLTSSVINSSNRKQHNSELPLVFISNQPINNQQQVSSHYDSITYRMVQRLHKFRGNLIKTAGSRGRKRKGSICFFIQQHLEPFHFHPLKLILLPPSQRPQPWFNATDLRHRFSTLPRLVIKLLLSIGPTDSKFLIDSLQQRWKSKVLPVELCVCFQKGGLLDSFFL